MKSRPKATAIFLLLIIATFIFLKVRPSSPAVSQNAIVNGPKPSSVITYACKNAKTITASFFDATTTMASVNLSLSDGRSFSLAQTVSADGVRYSNDDQSFVFWTRGYSALVLEYDKEKDFTGCSSTGASR